MLYKCLKRRIEKGNYESKEALAEQISLIYANEQLTAEQYAELADSAGAAANDIEGMIAQIGATGTDLDKTFSNISSGKGASGDSGSSSKKDPDYIEYLEDEADRYHDINLELEDLETNLSRLDKQQKKLYGQDLINNLNEQEQQYQLKINL